MYGLIFDGLEKFVREKCDIDCWSSAMRQANLDISWVINENYPDQMFFDLALSVSRSLGKPLKDFVEDVGFFFLDYVR
jgi:hypothetical protein